MLCMWTAWEAASGTLSHKTSGLSSSPTAIASHTAGRLSSSTGPASAREPIAGLNHCQSRQLAQSLCQPGADTRNKGTGMLSAATSMRQQILLRDQPAWAAAWASARPTAGLLPQSQVPNAATSRRCDSMSTSTGQLSATQGLTAQSATVLDVGTHTSLGLICSL